MLFEAITSCANEELRESLRAGKTPSQMAEATMVLSRPAITIGKMTLTVADRWRMAEGMGLMKK